MTIANVCVVIAAIMPVVTVALAKATGAGKPRREGGYDNNNPRAWLQTMSGWRARAVAAQQNGFEALPLFIGAVAIAQGHAAQAHVDQLALGFIGARLVYTALYLTDMASLRSLVWTVGFALCVAILFA